VDKRGDGLEGNACTPLIITPHIRTGKKPGKLERGRKTRKGGEGVSVPGRPVVKGHALKVTQGDFGMKRWDEGKNRWGGGEIKKGQEKAPSEAESAGVEGGPPFLCLPEPGEGGKHNRAETLTRAELLSAENRRESARKKRLPPGFEVEGGLINRPATCSGKTGSIHIAKGQGGGSFFAGARVGGSR